MGAGTKKFTNRFSVSEIRSDNHLYTFIRFLCSGVFEGQESVLFTPNSTGLVTFESKFFAMFSVSILHPYINENNFS